jgi:hypothetical protein
MTSSSAAAAPPVVSWRAASRRIRGSVLLLEAGSDERVDAVRNATAWMSNIGSTRDWQFEAEPCAALLGRRAAVAHGQGPGRRLQHQRAHLGARSQARFRYVGRTNRRPGWSYASVWNTTNASKAGMVRRTHCGAAARAGIRHAAARSHTADRRPDGSERAAGIPGGRGPEWRRHGGCREAAVSRTSRSRQATSAYRWRAPTCARHGAPT